VRVTVDGVGYLLAKAAVALWIACGEIEKEGFFAVDAIRMTLRTTRRVFEWEKIALETLITDGAAERQVIPIVGGPVIAGSRWRSASRLSPARFRALVLHITIRADPRLAEAAFAVLVNDHSALHGGVCVDATLEGELA